MRGKKYDEDVKQKLLKEALKTGNTKDVAERHGIPESTVRTWVIDLTKKSDKQIKELRQKRKQQFIENCWEIIEKGQRVLNKKLDDDDEVKEMSISNVSTMLGTMYDKQALASDEATEIVKEVKLEDFAE